MLTYKLGDAMGQNMLSPMIVHQGFSDTEYIAINKLVRFWCLVIGSLVAGALIARFGMSRLLFGAGMIMMIANLLFALVAHTGHSVPLLTLAVATENLFAAISLTVFATYLSGLSNTAFTATQYALLSSVAAVARTFATTPSGIVADRLGLPQFLRLLRRSRDSRPGRPLLHAAGGLCRRKPCARKGVEAAMPEADR